MREEVVQHVALRIGGWERFDGCAELEDEDGRLRFERALRTLAAEGPAHRKVLPLLDKGAAAMKEMNRIIDTMEAILDKRDGKKTAS